MSSVNLNKNCRLISNTASAGGTDWVHSGSVQGCHQ
jgi:hypothetical protein